MQDTYSRETSPPSPLHTVERGGRCSGRGEVRATEEAPLGVTGSELPREPTGTEPLLRVEQLSVAFPGRRRRTRETVVQTVSFDVRPNDFLGIVGESGSGKTITALAMMGLLPPQAIVEQGRIWFEGTDLLSAPEAELRRVRGSKLSMIFQSPRSSLNPIMQIGKQLTRAYTLRLGIGGREARERAIEVLRTVGIRTPERVMASYPHQLSGGMCQRVVIAMMVACHPRILIADEPTTALDVTVQAQIFELLKSLREQIGMAVVLITHDLGVVAETCARVAVMYRGQLMEVGEVEQIFGEPHHPYTRYLLGSILRIDRTIDISAADAEGAARPQALSGGCRFAGRCPNTMPKCWTVRPPVRAMADGRLVACHLYE